MYEIERSDTVKGCSGHTCKNKDSIELSFSIKIAFMSNYKALWRNLASRSGSQIFLDI